jgi:hypothetical protein
MPIPYQNLEDFAIKIVRAEVSHEELIRMLSDNFPDSRFREILSAEIQKRALEKIERSSRKLEFLTYALVFLTFILMLLTGCLVYVEFERHSLTYGAQPSTPMQAR